MAERVTIDIENHIAQVRLQRADKMNAVDSAMFDALIEAGESIAANGDIRAVVLSGEGRAFCAGLDMQSFSLMQQEASGEDTSGMSGDVVGRAALEPRTHGIANRFQKAVWVWRETPVPVIAAVHGVAFGGGFQIALAADMRFVRPDTRLSVLEIKWGLVPDMGGTQLMRHLARDDIIRELTYTGREFTGAEAKEYGFATRVCDDPLAEATEVAREIAQKSPDAIEANKRIFNQAPYLSDADGLLLESVEQDKLMLTPNQIESIAAAIAKRAANFKNAR